MSNFVTVESKEQFEQIVEKYPYVLVDFNAEWCGPCKAISPYVHSLAKSNSQLVVLDVDVDVNTELAKKYRIKSVPTFMMFVGGKKVKAFSGASKEALNSVVATYVVQD